MNRPYPYLLQNNRTAFKEWASIVEVLGKGEQILILRKGGIHEKGKKFDVAFKEFFLFPTFEHQNPKDLKPEVGAYCRANRTAPDDRAADRRLTYWCHTPLRVERDETGLIKSFPIQYYCKVEDSFWISDKKALESLEPFHVWSRECIEARFEWGDQKGLFGIVVRTFALPAPFVFKNEKRYGGCRSWVELEKPVSTADLKPVLPDKIFQEKKSEIFGRGAIYRAQT